MIIERRLFSDKLNKSDKKFVESYRNPSRYNIFNRISKNINEAKQNNDKNGMDVESMKAGAIVGAINGIISSGITKLSPKQGEGKHIISNKLKKMH